MRNVLKWTMGSALALLPLVLPGCSFNVSGLAPLNFNPGDQPRHSTIFCDIESRAELRRCATDTDKAMGIPLARAAVALTRHQSSNIGLDYSPGAIAAQGCASGQPVAIVFKCPFPDGCAECLNCGGVIGPVYADPNAACVANCNDVNGNTFGENPPAPEVVTFCQAHARTSTNAPGCFDGACSDAGGLRPDFADPRRIPEPVVWTDVVNLDVTGSASNGLTRSAAATGQYDAGAASAQSITKGDGWVEFTATETTTARALGLSVGPRPDTDPSLNGISYAIRLSNIGNVLVHENGVQIMGPGTNGTFTTYAAGDRLRVTVVDKLDGTAKIAYSKIAAGCTGDCTPLPFYESLVPAAYPLRADATIRDQGGTLTDVRLVRIK